MKGTYFLPSIIPAKTIFSKIHSRMGKLGYSEIHVNQEGDFVSVHRVNPITHDGYLLLARTAFSEHADNSPKSPITLFNQSVSLIQSASLQVNPYFPKSPRRRSISASEYSYSEYSCSPNASPKLEPISLMFNESYGEMDPFNQIHGSDGNIFGEKLQIEDEPPHLIQSPSQLFHHMGVALMPQPHVDIANVVNATIIANKLKPRIIGVISGIPSTLDFSTSFTSMTNVSRSDSKTDISILDDFVPGSIVMYRTWMNNSPIYEDKDRCDSPNSDVFITEPVKKSSMCELLGISECDEIEIMVKFGYSNKRATELWYTDDKEKWPVGLFNAIENLGDLEINAALYRSGPEESDFTNGICI